MLVLLSALLALGPPTFAQDSAAAASLERLPSALSIPPAVYPPDALAAGREASVLLQLTVDATGRVLEAVVTEPAGEGFDEAARLALLGARFTPALDASGQPVPALIAYRYRFTAAAAPPLCVEGRITLASGAPLADHLVRATTAEGEQRFARTDAEGAFRFAGLAPGPWTVIFEDPAFSPEVVPVEVQAGLVSTVDLVAQVQAPAPRERADDTLVIEAERIRPEVSERRLSQEEIQYLPGTNGDVVKVVQNLPGVARAPLGTGALIIRGAAPEDSAAFLDGARIPVVFHFSGLTTIVSSDLIDEVAFVPGNASARYGRFLAGLVELRTSPEAPDASHGHVSVDLYQTAVFVEQPIGEGGLSLSVRRSYADAVLVPIFNAVPDLSIRAPRYYDAQVRAIAKMNDTDLDALVILSNDSFALLGGDDSEAPVQIGLSTKFWRARLNGITPLGDGWKNELNLGLGADVQSFVFDATGEAEENNDVVTLREELSRPIAEDRRLGWRLGLDMEAGPQRFLYDVATFGPREQGSTFRFAPAAYVEPTIQLGGLRLIPGLRADGLLLASGYAKANLDPRLSARWALTDTTALRLGLGRYSQFPTVRQLLPDGDGNPELGPAHSLQSSLGLDQQLGPFSVEATLFYNHLTDLVVGREDRLRFFSGPPPQGPLDSEPYANDGVGRVCGGELLVRLQADNTLALLSVTASNSARVKRPGQDEVLFEYDQPLVVNALASQELPRNYRIGARARYGSGNPTTPVVNRIYDMGSRSFIPVFGEPDSERLPPFFSLDVRGDKTWEPRWGTLSLYLDVQNATNRKNVEVMSWTYDYGETDPVDGLPIFPTFGLEARW